MRIAAYDNYLTKLATSTRCLDVNEMDKYISNTTKNDIYLINKQIERIKKLIKDRYEHYGVINEQDNIEAFKQGYYDLGKIGLTLDMMRKKIEQFRVDKESPMGIQIEKDWNHAAFLLQDLLQLENMNLINYLNLLEERRNDLEQQKIKKVRKPIKRRQTVVQKEVVVEKAPDMPSDLMCIDEVCEMLHVSRSFIYRLACNHEIPHYKLLPNRKKNRLFFSRLEIEAFIKKNRVVPISEFNEQFSF